jgi:hypothetical protein
MKNMVQLWKNSGKITIHKVILSGLWTMILLKENVKINLKLKTL